jgi:hypothetical protein
VAFDALTVNKGGVEGRSNFCGKALISVTVEECDQNPCVVVSGNLRSTFVPRGSERHRQQHSIRHGLAVGCIPLQHGTLADLQFRALMRATVWLLFQHGTALAPSSCYSSTQKRYVLRHGDRRRADASDTAPVAPRLDAAEG